MDLILFCLLVVVSVACVETTVIWLVLKRPSGLWVRLVFPVILITVICPAMVALVVVALLWLQVCHWSYGPWDCSSPWLYDPLNPLVAMFTVSVAVLVVLVTESLLLVRLFRRLHRSGLLKEPASTPQVAAATLAAICVGLLFLVGTGILLLGLLPAPIRHSPGFDCILL